MIELKPIELSYARYKELLTLIDPDINTTLQMLLNRNAKPDITINENQVWVREMYGDQHSLQMEMLEYQLILKFRPKSWARLVEGGTLTSEISVYTPF